jgi:hypothetical protein
MKFKKGDKVCLNKRGFLLECGYCTAHKIDMRTIGTIVKENYIDDIGQTIIEVNFLGKSESFFPACFVKAKNIHNHPHTNIFK